MDTWQTGEPIEKWRTYEVRPAIGKKPLIRVEQRLGRWEVFGAFARFSDWQGWEWRVAPEALKPGRYRSPDGVEGELYPFDAFAGCYRFAPDGHVAPAIVGPNFPDGLTRFGKDATSGWVRLGD